MPFFDTNSYLTTKPSNFDIKYHSNSESYDKDSFLGTKVRDGPATYKKSNNIVMFWPIFDPLKGIWGIPDQNNDESLHKTDCFNLLSDCWIEVHSAI